MQEAMTRLGSKMPYEQAVEEVWLNQHTCVEESTLRGTTNRHGKAAEAIAKVEAEQLAREAPPATATPQQLLVSADGALIRMTNGEWREVKTVVVGEFESQWNEQESEVQVKTRDISYFSRSYQIREFEQYALPELHRRGLDNASVVATVNDGSEWIQSFADYHFPRAVRILDFRHALDYVSAAGKAVLGEGTEAFRQWFADMAHQLKHKPPQRTIADICLLQSKATTDEQVTAIDAARRYLQKRHKMIDYPHFQAKGLPIGSGSVESSHKVVVHSRMKQGGMRWAEDHIDPMLALRNLVCNGRWSPGWKQIVAFHWQQRRQELREQARRQQPSVPPITFASVKVASPVQKDNNPSLPPSKNKEPYRPAPDHPWRRDIWPTKEAWRWN
jgi:hypothetical protein